FASLRPGTNTIEMNATQATPMSMASMPTDLSASWVLMFKMFKLGNSFIVQYSVRRISLPTHANSPAPLGQRQSDWRVSWRADDRSEFDNVVGSPEAAAPAWSDAPGRCPLRSCRGTAAYP